ncbi:MAG TPA: TonB family protein [Terracidiphilus sp.]
MRFLALSLALHIVVSTVAFYSSRHPKIQVVRQETKYYPVHLYLPGGIKAKSTMQPVGRKKHPQASHDTPTSFALNAHPAPPAGAPVSTPHDSVPGNGTDAESANPAFPVFSPRPPVSDRSLLPASELQVVVDVKVSAIGEVLEATLVKGIGNGLDQIVLDTVKTWRFHPATLNGNPVATEAELIFPFNQGYPTTPS